MGVLKKVRTAFPYRFSAVVWAG